MNNRTKELITAALVFVAAILLAMNTTRYFGRIDMTETKEFTITNTTKEYIKTIPEQVNLTYFISDKVRAIAPAAGQIEDLLFASVHQFPDVAVNDLCGIAGGIRADIFHALLIDVLCGHRA